ncbi:UNC93-like protein isoform X2 [Uloborus diversus]|uniref:UNC93-like protein isoform X2 n=1 Tax=Uloborus diversus TaxID=327109 RepID=UPI00240A7049|nr:UNC93-like protein isoform X2 [Uloborus diversus]
MMEEIREDEAANQSLLTSTINCDSTDMHPKPNIRTVPVMSRSRVLKNMVVMSFSLFIFYLGFQGLANLQSTMNSAKGLGMNSQAVIYGSSMLSSLLFPELLIRNLGSKKTLVLMTICSVPYIASNFYPRYQTLMPAAVMFGLAAGPLGTSQTVYVNEMSLRYHKNTPDEPLEAIMARFFGLFSFFSENAQIWGNLVSYFVLDPGMVPIINGSHLHCGIDFRTFSNNSNDSNPNLQPPTAHKRYLLVSIYVALGLMSAVLMTFFLDPLKNDVGPAPEESRWKSLCCPLLAAAQHFTQLDQLLLTPLTIFVGMEIAFYTSDFTQAYIACSWGVHHVGFVTICFGVCGALTALLVGPLVKCITQMCVLILAACITVVMCAFLFLWQPSPDHTVVYFLFAGVWGMGDAIWWSQISALYGLMFPHDREAAFSNFFFWSFLGYLLSYSYANVLTVSVKVYILLSILTVGMAGYFAAQLRVRCSAKKDYIVIVDAAE